MKREKANPEDKQLAAYAKALGHPMRVRIMRVLAEQGSCQTGSLVELMPVAQSTVSEHLRILREAGLVSGEIDGPRRCYCIDQDGLASAKRLLQIL
ncbi:MAG TPA: metalloregulator ArsR/SmtB family transcription factor [Xanthomonadales bacterium]|nr:metalloregulator ArsR/SmtB family transcription factor [Xanthomonadales bacterium]